MEKSRFEKAKKSSSIALVFLPIGIVLMIASALEQSYVWTAMICVTGWCGIAMGLGATTGWTQYLLGYSPYPNPAPPLGNWKVQLIGIFTYWGPNIAVVLLLLMINGALPKDLRPEGIWGKASLVQVSAMYFCYTGSLWLGVYRATHGSVR